jgi:hypothetical protein
MKSDEIRGVPADASGANCRVEWSRPVLRKLPIAATATSQGKTTGNEDDGNCVGKGEVLNPACS